jgi:hypothetical protein
LGARRASAPFLLRKGSWGSDDAGAGNRRNGRGAPADVPRGLVAGRRAVGGSEGF